MNYWHALCNVFMITLLCLLTTIAKANILWDSDGSLEESLHEKAPNLDTRVLDIGLDAYRCAVHHKQMDEKHIFTIIDYSMPSNKKRMWVFDMDDQKVLYHTYVAHGKGSGLTYAKHFSNRRGSHATSLGLMLTGHTYYGHRGYSLRLHGLEKGINSNVFPRHVVIHPAWYASKHFLHKYHRLGRSYGCPALGRSHSREIINTIKNHTLIFNYYPKSSWLHQSDYLHCG